MYSEFSEESVKNVVSKMIAERKKKAKDVENLHVSVSYGNSKTGVLVPSVSLIPVADCCSNCKCCKAGCYDVRHDCIYPTVQKSRANNSALLHGDPDRYFCEISKICHALRFFRWHVGGDIINSDYFRGMLSVARANKNCEFLVFTKNYDVVNSYVDNGGAIPENMHIIFSDWRGAEIDNKYNFPLSSPRWTTADGVEYGPNVTGIKKECGGNCSACAVECGGCWSLQPGETIIFDAH